MSRARDIRELLAWLGATATCLLASASFPLAMIALAAFAFAVFQRAPGGRRSPALWAGLFSAGAFALLAMHAAPQLAAAATAATGCALVWRVLVEGARGSAVAERGHVGGRPPETGIRRALHLWAPPVLGLCLALGAPRELSFAAGALAAVAMTDWAFRRLVDWRLGETDRAALVWGVRQSALVSLLVFPVQAEASLAALLALPLLRRNALPGKAPSLRGFIPGDARRIHAPRETAAAH